MAVPAAQALLYDLNYLESPEDLLYCPAINPQLTYADNWKYDPVANPTWKDTYTNYCWWIGFNPPAATAATVIVGPGEVVGAGLDGEPGTARATDFWPRDQASPADRVMITELCTQSGPLADKYGPRRHAPQGPLGPSSTTPTQRPPTTGPLGGNVMLNDGSCRWVAFAEQQWRVNQLNPPIFLSFYY